MPFCLNLHNVLSNILQHNCLFLFQIAIKLTGVISGPYLALFLMGMFARTINEIVRGTFN